MKSPYDTKVEIRDAELAPSLQTNGGILGEGMLADGCFYPGKDMTVALVFGWEAFCTFCFILPIFSVVWYTLHKKGYGNTGPLMVGLSLIANAIDINKCGISKLSHLPNVSGICIELDAFRKG